MLKDRINEYYRLIFTRLHVDKNVIVCTDGKRLHIVQKITHAFPPPGNYEVIRCSRREIILHIDPKASFPKWRKIIPDVETEEWKKINEFDMVSWLQFALIRLNGPVISTNYLEDVLISKYNACIKSWDCYFKDIMEIIVLKCQQFTALIMPISPSSIPTHLSPLTSLSLIPEHWHALCKQEFKKDRE